MRNMQNWFFAVLVVVYGCGGGEKISLPPLPLAVPVTVEQAKEQARLIASQKCQYSGYKDLGIDDAGGYMFECEKGSFAFEVTQSHTFDSKWYWKFGDNVQFRFSEKMLMKPVYLKEGKPQENNPAYYLEPLGTEEMVIPPPPPPPTPVKSPKSSHLRISIHP